MLFQITVNKIKIFAYVHVYSRRLLSHLREFIFIFELCFLNEPRIYTVTQYLHHIL